MSTEERIEEIDVTDEMQNSYVDYALSVIHSRALPDARDGLKPVQRRIVYQMTEMGLMPNKGHVKSARVVGDVMGKLHPHGDSAIYDALVRLARPFAMSVPLVDGHGNFGSLDDGPAAARYTEARLTLAATLMTEDLDEDVVDFVPNYDNQYQQPEVLPSAFPNLLVNGATGIAVGMATNMAPHNPGEAIAAARYLLAHPEATLEDLMEVIPGPDLPSGGTILGLNGVREAYATGRGSFQIRATTRVESITARKRGIVVTALPYMVGPEQVIEKIKDGVNAKRIVGISNVQDLTDRQNGLKMVIELKTGFDPEAVLQALYKYTPLEVNFGMNNVVLVDGQPRTVGLKEMLRVYLDHRISVIRRRSRHRLTKAQERLHLVEGLLVAILDIDEVIAVIRSSESSEEARTRLMQVFDLSREQAEHILELRLRRLTKFSQIELEAERDELRTKIAELEEVLSDQAALFALVDREFVRVSDLIDVPRRTVLLEAQDRPKRGSAKPAQAAIEDVPCRVLLSASGRVVRVDPRGDGADGTPDAEPYVVDAPLPSLGRSPHDAVVAEVATTTRSELGALLSDGRVVRFPVVDLPHVNAHAVQLSAGPRLADYLEEPIGKLRIVTILSLRSAVPLAIGTRGGVVKRTVVEEQKNKPGWEVIALKDGDEVIGAAPAPDGAELVFVTAQAQLLRFAADTVRPQGRTAGGMAGIRLGANDRAIGFAAVTDPAHTVAVTHAHDASALPGSDPGSLKVSPLDEFPAKGRATGGVRAQRFVKGETELEHGWVVQGVPVALGAQGNPASLPERFAKRDASGERARDAVAMVGAAAS